MDEINEAAPSSTEPVGVVDSAQTIVAPSDSAEQHVESALVVDLGNVAAPVVDGAPEAGVAPVAGGELPNADLAALSVANMVAQQVSTPFIDQIAIGSTPQPAGELPNVGGAIADPSAVAPISTDAPSSPAAMSASGSAELPNVSPSPTGTPDASTTSATSGSAHIAVNALDRFMERISNDFAREGKALVDAMRAEISKLVP